jgi:energy-coupling factor transport system substrate-specific component
MSWQIGAFLVLGLGLIGGFGWYERARPDARIVALVATLAAFAALGRIAFAALPNIKPTTDIVLVSGYALGGAPGFVVGAVAGLTSNFFFGQGPWTPWQMAAWGLTGLVGAGLARASRGRIGRWPLALACTVIGFLFTVLQDAGDWVTYSDHSAGQLAAYVGSGLGFDCIDAAGCLLFAIAFGPALLRSVTRFARRLQVRWEPPAERSLPERSSLPGTLPLVVLALCGLLAAGRAVPAARAATRGRPGRAAALRSPGSPLGYLLSAQNPDGGFGAAAGQASAPLYSGWAALALEADGRNPAGVVRDGHSLLSYIGATLPSDPGSIERTILVAVAAGIPVTDFAGHDLTAELERRIDPDGSVAQQVDLTNFAILALRAAGAGPPVRMLSWLERQQDSDGGFSFATAGDLADVDDTGAALEALAGADPAASRRAVAYLREAENRDGGFPSEPGGPSNAQSTAWAIQGLIAAGVNPADFTNRGSSSPLQYLRSLITPSGAVEYARGSEQTPVWVTAEAILALDGRALPLDVAPSSGGQGPAGSRRAAPARSRRAATAGSRRAGRRRAVRRSRAVGRARRVEHRSRRARHDQRTAVRRRSGVSARSHVSGATHRLRDRRPVRRRSSAGLGAGALSGIAIAAAGLLAVLAWLGIRRRGASRV